MQPSGGAFTHVVATDTDYYESGPAQARPPEGVLEAELAALRRTSPR